MEYVNFTLQIRDHVAILKLNRPDKANALTNNALMEIAHALESVQDNEEVCSVLLYGEGKHFCSGNDLQDKRFSKDGKARNYLVRWEDYEIRHASEMKIYHYPKPTVVAVHGLCLGAGFELAALGDFMIASEDATFGLPEMRMSIVPLSRLVYAFNQMRFAKEAIMTGENFGADRAYQMGLVNKVVPQEKLLDEAMVLARKLALMPPETMKVAKQVCNKVNRIQGFDLIAEESKIYTIHSLELPTKMREQFNAIGAEQGLGAAFKWQKEYFAQANKPFAE